MRISEALGLNCADVGPDGATITVAKQFYRGVAKSHTKSANGQRTISVPPQLAARLWATCADRTGPLFATRTGQRLSARNVNRTLEAAAQAASPLPHVSPHTLRHVHGTKLATLGWPSVDIAHRLGDSVQTVEAVYMHPDDSGRDIAVIESAPRNADDLEETLARGSTTTRPPRRRQRSRPMASGIAPGTP